MSSSPTPQEVRVAREQAGLTQTQAGDLVHSSLRAWQQWEAGDRAMHPGLWELFQIKAAGPENRPQEPRKARAATHVPPRS